MPARAAGAGRAPRRARRSRRPSRSGSATSTSKVDLGRLRLDLALGGERRVVLEAGAPPQPAAHARPEGRLELGRRRARAAPPGVRDRPSARAWRPSSGRCPGTRPGDSPAKRSSASARERTTRPGRLAELAGDLRQHPVLGDADRAGQPGPLADLGRDPSHRRLRREEPGQLDVGLVEADHFDGLRVGAQDRHHLAGGLAVGAEVGAQVDRVGQPPPRDRGRHRRVDPGQPARLIARRRHHRPRPRAADDHRLALQLRPAPQLDRRVEGVHVQMGDAAGPDPSSPQGRPGDGGGRDRALREVGSRS